jgi:hypothetical protein
MIVMKTAVITVHKLAAMTVPILEETTEETIVGMIAEMTDVTETAATMTAALTTAAATMTAATMTAAVTTVVLTTAALITDVTTIAATMIAAMTTAALMTAETTGAMIDAMIDVTKDAMTAILRADVRIAVNPNGIRMIAVKDAITKTRTHFRLATPDADHHPRGDFFLFITSVHVLK